MKTKNIPIRVELFKYINSLDFISDDEIVIAKSILNENEVIRLNEYLISIWKNINNKRLFCFIANLVDFSSVSKNSWK